MLDVDVEKERISLGIKQLAADPLEAEPRRREEGRRRHLHRHRRSPTAASRCTLASGLPGFIRKAELSRDRAEQRPDRFAVGEKVDAKVTALDRATRKLSLSIKAREVDEEKQAMAEFGSSDSGASLGDILGAAISRARSEGEQGRE